MFGLSPLSSGHPPRFQPRWVRPSTGSYPCFSLPKDSSPGFASAACDSLAILKARFRCGSFPNLTSPHTATRWLILQKARRHTASVLRLLVGARFQVLFHSPLGVLFTFPSRYWFAIGHTCPAVLGYRLMRGARCRVRGSHPVPPAFPCRSATKLLCNRIPGRQTRGGRPRNTTRSNACRLTRAWVWAGALSLAATRAISVDFSSSGYLDVSVPRVASLIAASHVLRRLPVPRHPPCALDIFS